jgi:hypothetical protein
VGAGAVTGVDGAGAGFAGGEGALALVVAVAVGAGCVAAELLPVLLLLVF